MVRGRKLLAYCKRGHCLAGDNRMPMANGSTRCRECAYEYKRKQREAIKRAKEKAKEMGE